MINDEDDIEDEEEFEEDYEEYDDEDEPITLEDIKNVADTVKSIVDAGTAVKKLTETPRPPNSQSSGTFDPKEMERQIREAKENAVPKMWVKGTGTPPPKPPLSSHTTNGGHHWTRGEKLTVIGLIMTAAIGIPGLYATGIFDDFISAEPLKSINESEIIEDTSSDPIIPYQKIWEVFEKNRPYGIEWTTCSFGTQTSQDGITSWSFDMTPIMINNKNQTAVIPFHMSYNFRYEGVNETGNFSLRDIVSEGSQKFLVDHRASNSINFTVFSNALNYALENEIYKIQIIKSKSGFVPYSDDGDDNLLSNYQHQDDDVLVTQFEYDAENDTWNKIDIPKAICSEIRRI